MQGPRSRPSTAAGLCLAFALAGWAPCSAAQDGVIAPTATATAAAELAPSAAASASPLDSHAIAAGTVVEIELLQDISSASAQRGDRFPVRLAEPLVVDGVTRLAAGLPGVGQVVHAARPRAGGGGGELLVTVRALHAQDRCIPLRGFSLGGNGKHRTAAAVGVASALGVVGLLVRGNDLVLPAGTRGTAKLRDDFSDLPATDAPATNQPIDKESDPCVIV